MSNTTTHPASHLAHIGQQLLRLRNNFMNRYLLVLLLSFASCKPILKITGYYRTPHIQTTKSVKIYADKNCFPYTSLCVLPSREVYDDFIKKHPSVPSVVIYDSLRRKLINPKKRDCSWAAIKSFAHGNSTSFIASEGPEAEFKNLQPIGGDANLSLSKYKYIVVFEWAIFSPKLSKEMAHEIKALTDSCDNTQLAVVCINVDVQQQWNQ